VNKDNQFLNRHFITTEDGSKSLYLPELDETYHNRRGAITESKYIFIDWGLDHFRNYNYPVNILEIGFGTGLNALLSLQYSEKHNLVINYHSIEPFPLSAEEWSKLNYHLDKYSEEQFMSLHRVLFGGSEANRIDKRFNLFKYRSKIQDLEFEKNKFDLVFYDAFAPSKQPDMWSLELLARVKNCMASPSLLVTYCSQGQFKRNLKSLGFNTEHPVGPLGKKEMTIARL